MKLLQRKFAVPSSAAALTLFNDAAQLGFSDKTMVLVVVLSLGYALIEALHDIARMKYGATTITAPEGSNTPPTQ